MTCTGCLKRTLGSLFWCAAVTSGCHGTEAHAGAVESADAGLAARLIQLDRDTVKRLGIRATSAGETTAGAVLRLPGTLDYNLNRFAEIGALLEGRVSRVMVSVGDHVRAGQALATLIVPSIANAQATYLTASAAALAAQENLDREESLLKHQLTTSREAEMARSEAARAEAELAAGSAKLRALRVALPKNRDAVEAAGAHTLTTPIDGVVVKRDAVLGAFIEPTKTAFAVADLNELWATLDIYESDLPYLRVGAAVQLSFDAIPNGTFQGKVALLEPQLGSATRSVRARVAVPNPDNQLRPGFFCRATIALPTERLTDRIPIPTGAVQPLGDEDVVFIERNLGAYEIRPVHVMRRSTEIVEVSEGVSRGESIVVEGAFFLRSEATRQ